MRRPREALVLAAHGSHKNAGSGEPARELAAALAGVGRFDQVVAAFWKEFPSLREVRYLVDAEVVYVVPLFMADGYFAARVVPRELELDGPVTEREGVRIHYTPPVGTDPRMTEVIAARALEAVGDAVRPDELAVVVVGHGTVQNRQSRQTVEDHARRLAERGVFAETAACYLEEAPLVSQAAELVAAENLVVVPLFVADGLHTDEDIPRLLGLSRRPDGAWQVPGELGGRRLWYTSSVGTSPAMVEVILARVEQAREGRYQ